MSRNRRGMVLLVTLGMLTILTLLATTFVALAGVERDTASNYVLEARAMMLAHSGVDYAVTLFKTPMGQSPRAIYGGEDWSGLREAIGTADGNNDDANGNRNGIVDIAGCDLRFARRPSFFADADSNGLPDLISIAEGPGLVQRGYTGRMQGTYHANGDTFSVSAIDTASMVYINGKGTGFRRLFDNLGQLALTPAVAGLGLAIQSRQPFGALEELVAKGAMTQTQFDQVRPFLTVYTWEDPATMRPDPQSSLLVRPENMRRLTWVEPRAPINVNTADFLVVKSALMGISGYSTDNNTPTKSLFTLDATRADNLARAIVVAREETYTDANANKRYDVGEAYGDLNANGQYDGPFQSWEHFKAFLPGVTGYVGNFNTWARNLVLANANPNSLLNKFQPDHHRWTTIDKSDLVVSTTEFCFEATGYFRIRSLGRITNPNFLPVAEKEIEVTVKLFDTARLTTQEDFESANIKLAIGPDVMTIPEEVAEILPESYVDTNGDKRFTKGDAFTDSNGDGMRDGPAIYDGQLTLRNADPSDSGPWGDAASLAFRALFTDSITVDALGPDKYPSFAGDIALPTTAQGIPMTAAPLTTTVDRGGSLIKDLNGANSYSDLFPDGMFIRKEFLETVYWTSILNWPVGQGSMGFWVKPTWVTIPSSIAYRDMLILNQNYQFSPNRGRVVFLFAMPGSPSPGNLILRGIWYNRRYVAAGTSAVTSDAAYNPPAYTSTMYVLPWGGRWGPGQWHYFGIRYTNQVQMKGWLDATPFLTYIESPYMPGWSYIWSDPVPSYNYISLGSNMPGWDTLGSGTYDDFRIWAAQVPSSDIGLTPPWRFDDTGYAGYSMYEGQFHLPAGARVRTLSWTEYRPTQSFRSESLSSTTSTARRKRPDVGFSYKLSSEAAWRPSPALATPDGFDGGPFDADATMPTLGAGQTLHFKFAWDRRGQDPFRNSPAVDDVTVTYSTGQVQYMNFQILHQ